MKKQRFSNSVLITGIIVFGIIFLALIGVLSDFSYQGRTVTSNGYAMIKVLPDKVSIYFNIQTYGNTSSEANEKNSEIFGRMKNLLEIQGFGKDEIQTQGLSIYPEYDYSKGKSEITRYVASHSIKIEIPVNDSEKVGKVIDSGVNAGA
ncbi:SIMPL domain-containing protein [Candidatus Pacearchaeota archaeon]|nr:SIMPL domain-containing protein [Candidatus Pacearchaeota archaeon]